ncbi:hypothetical protein [Streptomyces sp. SYSU K217416]
MRETHLCPPCAGDQVHGHLQSIAVYVHALGNGTSRIHLRALT